MDPCHGDPSPLDPMKSVCLHFPPLSLLYFAVYFLSLSRTNTRRDWWTLATVTRLHWIRWSPAVCRHVPPSPQLYTLYISRTDFRWVWMFVAFVHRTQIGCIGQPSRIVFLIVCSQFCLLFHGFFSRWTYNMCSASFDWNQWPWYLQSFYQNIGGKLIWSAWSPSSLHSIFVHVLVCLPICLSLFVHVSTSNFLTI